MITSKVLNEETTLLLENWGRWSRSLENYERLWYPSTSIQGRAAQSTNLWHPPENHVPIRDQDAERVEEAVVKLRSSDMQLGLCIKFRWSYEFSGLRLAKELHCSKNAVYPLTDRAEMALQGILWG